MECHSAVKPSPQAAGSLSAPETLHHPACSAATSRVPAAFPSAQKRQRLLSLSVEGGNKHSQISALKEKLKNETNCLIRSIKSENQKPIKHTSYSVPPPCPFFPCVYIFAVTCVCSVCSRPQENVHSSAPSAAPPSPRRATCCVTSSSTQGRSPSSVTCAATPVAGGTPSPATYAHTRVSKVTPAENFCTFMLDDFYKRHSNFCSTCSMSSGLCKGKLTGCRYGVTFFFQMLCRSTCQCNLGVNRILLLKGLSEKWRDNNHDCVILQRKCNSTYKKISEKD